MDRSRKPRLLITQGDPGGIGPELVARVVTDAAVREMGDLIVIGDPKVMRRALELYELPHGVVELSSPSDVVSLQQDEVGVIDVSQHGATYPDAQPSASGGHLTARSIETATDIVRAGDADAIASAPANKVALHAAGWHYPGQTELFVERFGLRPDVFHTMLLGGGMRVSLVTSHMSLRAALDEIRAERILRVARQTLSTLEQLFGVSRPRLGVAGVNPHAGDGGLFGREEIEELEPAIQLLRQEGFDVTEPRPADAVFWEAEQGRYDAVLGMYHDQGVVPLKRHGYVTLIAGVPFIRTTCGHGTAFDIAWKAKADHRLFRRAVVTALELAGLRPDVGLEV